MNPIYNDPKLEEIKCAFDRLIFEFIRQNAGKIVDQARADTTSEIPTVPLFDNYLTGLESQIQEQLKGIGYFNGVAKKIISGYRTTFYYSSLPNLVENR